MISLEETHAPKPELGRFESGGKQIRVETFSPPGEKSSSASVLVLHGATGVQFANRFIAGMAQSFANEGFFVHLIHYFDRTGATFASDTLIRRDAYVWSRTIDDAVEYVHLRRPAARIGIFGYSLGGYLAAIESVTSERVSAAVILAGGMDELSAARVRRAPPFLILHGANDTRVPLSECRRLEVSLRAAGGSPQVLIYPGEGHIMDVSTYGDIVHRGARFFTQHLRSA